MANPSNPNGTYTTNVNGMPGSLLLEVDANGQLVNSSIGADGRPRDNITGTYDNTTGRLAFTEFFLFPTVSLANYVGYGWVDTNGLGTIFAGAFTEMIIVQDPGGLFHFEFVERGWYASNVAINVTRGSILIDPAGPYTADVNGVLRALRLEVDTNGQLVNSSVGSTGGGQQDAVVGTYDKTSGRIDFSVLFPFPTLPELTVPRFTGYGVTAPAVAGEIFKILAGTFTEMMLVRGADGLFHFEFAEHGWYAITDFSFPG
jgi:hypothetical protein